MKQAKQRAKQQAKRIKPRSGIVPLLKKGGAHRRKDKRAARTQQQARFRRLVDEV